MNAIIVGINGRPSILEMISTYKFTNKVIIFAQYHKKTGDDFWKKITLMEDDYIGFEKTDTPQFDTGDKVVFWGSRANLNTGKSIVYNSIDFLKNASNKSLGRKLLKEAKVAIPKTAFSVEEAMNDSLDYPMIIRPETHRAGNDFYVAHNSNELRTFFNKVGNGYISEFYPKTAEYRIHIASGKVLLIKEKPKPDNQMEIAWNFAQLEKPWKTIDRKDYNKEMILLALHALDIVGLDFGAVDIMSYPSGNRYPEHVVTEINTSPSYTPYLIQKYGAYFDFIFSKETKIEKWDYSKFKKGKSFSWKNFQLKINKNDQ